MDIFEERGDQVADAYYEINHMCRKYAHLPAEYRVGAKFSSATLAVLKGMYKDMQAADNFLDSWLPKLAELLGEPNTNAEDNHNADGSPKGNDKSATANNDGPHTGTQTDGSSRSLQQKRRLEQRRMAELARSKR